MPCRPLAVLLILVGASTLRAEPPARWLSRGTGGGGAMFSPSLSPHQRDELYMAFDMGPEFHTTNFGKSWETLNFRPFVSDASGTVGGFRADSSGQRAQPDSPGRSHPPWLPSAP